jgi:hypothetical protein
VVVPASMRLVWAEQIEEWLPHMRPAHVHVIEGRDQRLTGLKPGKAAPKAKAAKAAVIDIAGATIASSGDGCGLAGLAAGGSGDEAAEPRDNGGAAGTPSVEAAGTVPGAGGAATGLPRITITSYEMLKRLSCDACIKGAALREPLHWVGADGGVSVAARVRPPLQQQQQQQRAVAGLNTSDVACRGPGMLLPGTLLPVFGMSMWVVAAALNALRASARASAHAVLRLHASHRQHDRGPAALLGPWFCNIGCFVVAVPCRALHGCAALGRGGD